MNDQILSFDKVMTFCTTNIKGITFFEISKDDMASVRERQKERYQLGNTVEGTRLSHHFEPQSCSAIRAKHVSAENRFSINHSLSLPPEVAHDTFPPKVVSQANLTNSSSSFNFFINLIGFQLEAI